MSYAQLTQEQRYQIYVLKKIGHKPAEIARCLGVHKSTIGRELRRNSGKRGYRPKQAQEKALERRLRKSEPRIDFKTWALIESKLRLDWSPEQISGWLKENSEVNVSHEWIYQYSMQTNKQAETCIPICAIRKSGANAMVAVIGEARCPIGQVSSNVQPPWSSESGWVTGKLIPSSKKAGGTPLSRW